MNRRSFFTAIAGASTIPWLGGLLKRFSNRTGKLYGRCIAKHDDGTITVAIGETSCITKPKKITIDEACRIYCIKRKYLENRT